MKIQTEITLAASSLPGLTEIMKKELLRGRKINLLKKHSGKDEIIFSCSERTMVKLPMTLRTCQSLSIFHQFDIPRPKALLGDQHYKTLCKMIRKVLSLQEESSFNGFRINAAGARSNVFQRLADELSKTFSLPFLPDDGELVITVRKSSNVWQVLVRMTPRPTGTREWRVENYVGSLNATIAAAMVYLGSPAKETRTLNMMCGSGTIMIEHLLIVPHSRIEGFDMSSTVLKKAQKNADAAGVSKNLFLSKQNILKDEFTTESRSYDLIYSDLPWGEKIGQRSKNKKLYSTVLEKASTLLVPGGSVVLLTQDIDCINECIKTGDYPFETVYSHKISQGGFTPTLMKLYKK